MVIVEANPGLGQVWAEHIERLGATTRRVESQVDAIAALEDEAVDVIIVDLTLPDNGGLNVAEFALFRHPKAKVIFVTEGHGFPDGSIFKVSQNAWAFVQSDLPPEDLAAIVEYHAAAR